MSCLAQCVVFPCAPFFSSYRRRRSTGGVPASVHDHDDDNDDHVHTRSSAPRPARPVDDAALYVAVRRRRWDRCRRLLNSPDAARLVAAHGRFDAVGGVLGAACGGPAPAELVRALWERAGDRGRALRDVYGRTHLHHACFDGRPETVALLTSSSSLFAGSDAEDDAGRTPLRVAVTRRRSARVVRAVASSSRRRPDAVRATLATWREDLEWFWPDLSRLPRGHRADGAQEGARTIRETLAELTRTASSPSTLHAVLSYEAVRIPWRFALLVLHDEEDGSAERRAAPDGEGNFPLHLVCARPPFFDDDDEYYQRDDEVLDEDDVLTEEEGEYDDDDGDWDRDEVSWNVGEFADVTWLRVVQRSNK